MFSAYEPLQCVFEVPGEAGFAIFGVTVKDDPDRIFEADALTSHASILHHGDIVLVTGRRRRHGPDAIGTAMHLAAMVHKDAHGRVTVTKLLELPHDAESLRHLLASMPAALRQGREGAPTETQPKRQRVIPERARIADGHNDGLARDAIAQGRRGELAERRDHDDRDDQAPAGDLHASHDADDTATPDASSTAGNVTDGPGARRPRADRRRGMNLR